MDINGTVLMDKNTFQKMKELYETLPVGISLYEFRDGDWSVLYFNKVICKLTGYSLEECEYLVKDNPWEFIDTRDLNSLKKQFDSLLWDESQANNKCRIKGKDKDHIVNISSKVILRRDEGTLIHNVYTDITDLEEEKESLLLDKEESRVISLLAERSKQFIFKYYFETDTYILCNDLSHYFIYNINKPFSLETFLDTDIVAPESIKDLAILFANIKDDVPKGSTVFKAKDDFGIWQWYHVKYTTVFDDDIVPLYSIIYFRNITGSRQKSIEARRFRDFSMIGSNQTFFNATYNLTLGTIEDIDGEIPDEYNINLEYSFDRNVSIIGEKVHPEDRKNYYNYLSTKRILRSFTKGINRGTFDFRIKSGSKYIWVKVVYHLLEDVYSTNYILWLSCKKIDEQKQSEIKLMTNAQRDELTGVYNRGTFKDKSIEKMERASGEYFSSIVLVDVDNFTRVNDIFGYSFGDKVLRDIARTIRLIIGEEDIVGRISGTRFILYLHNNQDLDTIEKKLEIINMAVSRATNDSLKLSISIGVTLYGRDGTEFDNLYEKADLALSYAKETGKNKYIFYNEKLKKHSINKMQLINDYDKEEAQTVNIDIRTFGYFDVFINGQAILIPHAKAKELLALLIHRKGGFVTPQEIIAHLWEDEEANKVTMARSRKVFMLLKDTLDEYDVADILDTNKGARRIIPEKINCDLYNYLSGDKKYANLFNGYYMLNYSWGEFSMAELEQQADRYNDM